MDNYYVFIFLFIGVLNCTCRAEEGNRDWRVGLQSSGNAGLK